jgi:hypothetical protein
MDKSEAKTQQEIVRYFRNNYCLKHHSPRCSIFSVPNEREGVQIMQKLKQTGLLSGVSDLIVLREGKVDFVEVKNKTGRQSEKQKSFEGVANALGFDYHLVRSLEDFKESLGV